MKSRRLILVLVLGLVAIATGWIYESRLRDDSAVVPLDIPDNIDYFLTDMRYRSMDTDGRPDFEFTSRRLEHRRKTDVSHIEVPSLLVFRAAANWQIDSQRAAYEHRVNLLQMEQNVVAQKSGDRPLQLYTERLVFEPDLDRISTDTSIVLLTGEGRIEAEAAVFDLAGDVYLLERARGIYN